MRLHLYLAPHFDDAVLSCGGLIARQLQAGDSVLALTIFAGDPPPGPRSAFARLLADAWQTVENYVAVRRAEDCAAVERLGARWLHWDYPDSIYRLGAGGEPLYPDAVAIFDQVHPCERGPLVGELALRLQALCGERRPATVFAPLTVGHHVDHHLVQWASRRLSLRGCALRFYEDYPYVAEPGSLQAALALASDAWQPQLEALAPAAWQAKIEAIACYRSQLHGLFGGEAAMPGLLKAYFHGLAADGPAERYWRPRGAV